MIKFGQLLLFPSYIDFLPFSMSLTDILLTFQPILVERQCLNKSILAFRDLTQGPLRLVLKSLHGW